MTARLGLVLVFAASLGLVAAAATAAGATSPPQPSSAPALAKLIAAKGLNCRDFQGQQSGGTCTVGHEFDVALEVFASKAQLAKTLPKQSSQICQQERQAHSTQPVVYVIGPNWVAAFESQANARPLAKALHAKTKTLSC